MRWPSFFFIVTDGSFDAIERQVTRLAAFTPADQLPALYSTLGDMLVLGRIF